MDPKRQKLIGLKTKDGKSATDAATVADLLIRPNTKIMMMGQPEAVIQQQDAAASAAPEVQVSHMICKLLCSQETAALQLASLPVFTRTPLVSLLVLTAALL